MTAQQANGIRQARNLATATANPFAAQSQQYSKVAGYLAGGIGGGGLLYYMLTKSDKVSTPDAPDKSHSITTTQRDDKHQSREPITFANLDFKLTDQQGTQWTKDEMLGQFALITFTDNWDDNAVTRLAETTRQSDRKSNLQQMCALVFLTNANQDQKQLQGKVAQAWNPEHQRKSDRVSDKGKSYDRLVALYGADASKVKQKAQRAAEALIGQPAPESNAGPSHAERVDVSPGVLMIVNPDGEVIETFGRDLDPRQIAETVANHIIMYQRHNPDFMTTKATKYRHA
jgi:cytochrome oxidase Cu insertion factor (SCO1/SenC/PrrC family)